MTKRILIFVLLKAVEIGGIGYAPYGLGRWIGFPEPPSEDFLGYWLSGAVLIIILISVVVLIGSVVCLNWEWTKKICNRN